MSAYTVEHETITRIIDAALDCALLEPNDPVRGTFYWYHNGDRHYMDSLNADLVG